MRLASACRSRLLVVLTFCVTIWNIFVMFKYQCVKQSVSHHEQGAILVMDEREPRSYLKELQMEINETFMRFEAKNRTIGKAFQRAALRGKNGKERRNDAAEIKTSLPDCKQTPFLLILIHSTPANFMNRDAIRMTWGSPLNSINVANAGKPLMPRLWKTVFLVGQTRNPSLDELLRQEANNYEDIVFGDFLDSYRNLTRKMVLGIEWAVANCQADFVMKADEDTFVAILELVQWLEKYQRLTGRRNKPLYMGAALIDKGPYREKDSPYYVSEKEYPAPKYPPYAGGVGYVFSGKLLENLSSAVKVVRLFPNEDACFGALMQHIKVSLLNNDKFMPFSVGKASYTQSEGYSLCQFHGPFVIHRISGKLQIQTHFNVLIVKHAPTICEHVKNGIGITDFFNDGSFEDDFYGFYKF